MIYLIGVSGKRRILSRIIAAIFISRGNLLGILIHQVLGFIVNECRRSVPTIWKSMAVNCISNINIKGAIN